MRSGVLPALGLVVTFCLGGVTGWSLRPVVQPGPVASGPPVAVERPEHAPPATTPPEPVVAPTPAQEPVREITARTFRVLRVVDGDTIKIMYDGEPTSIRIAGIDTPERGDPGYDEAAEAMRQLVGGKTITIEFLDLDDKRDSFGRLLCRVEVDGVDVGQEMLRQGLADGYDG